MALVPETYTAPACWASYLINGDASGIDQEDIDGADAMVGDIGCGSPVSCGDDGEEPWFSSKADYMTHDADGNALAGDFLTYTFLRNTEGK